MLLEVGVEQVGREGPLAFFLDDYNQDDHQVPDRGENLDSWLRAKTVGREQIACPLGQGWESDVNGVGGGWKKLQM